MNDVQEKLSELQAYGWTLASIADELGITSGAVVKWKSGERYPGAARLVLTGLGALAKRRPPKQRRYPGTHHLQRDRKSETE